MIDSSSNRHGEQESSEIFPIPSVPFLKTELFDRRFDEL